MAIRGDGHTGSPSGAPGRWLNTKDASEELGLSVSSLRELQARGLLQPGEHWIYLTGRRHSPVSWNVDRIRAWQINETRAIVNGPGIRAQLIETYQENPKGS